MNFETFKTRVGTFSYVAYNGTGIEVPSKGIFAGVGRRFTGQTNTTRAQGVELVKMCTQVLQSEDLTFNQEEIVKSVLASMVAAEGRPYPRVELIFPKTKEEEEKLYVTVDATGVYMVNNHDYSLMRFFDREGKEIIGISTRGEFPKDKMGILVEQIANHAFFKRTTPFTI